MPDESVGDSRFRQLLAELSAGDENASKAIVDEYGAHILRAVRRRMNRGMRDRFDSEDFAQAVWASFFGHLSIVSRFQTQGELAGFLGRMASNKVIDAGRRQQSRKEKNTPETLPQVVVDNRLKVSQPTPSQFAVANEQWDQLNDNEGDRDQELLRQLRDGATQAEIAEKMGISDRHVRRILRRFARKKGRDTESDTE